MYNSNALLKFTMVVRLTLKSIVPILLPLEYMALVEFLNTPIVHNTVEKLFFLGEKELSANPCMLKDNYGQ